MRERLVLLRQEHGNIERGCIQLALGANSEANSVLRAVRDLGDGHRQHHFIGMYIELTLFRAGDWAAAAAQWHQVMSSAVVAGDIRAVAASIEGCGYIAARLGRAAEAARFLGAASRTRAPTGIPLLGFWNVHNESARCARRRGIRRGDRRSGDARGGCREQGGSSAAALRGRWPSDWSPVIRPRRARCARDAGRGAP